MLTEYGQGGQDGLAVAGVLGGAGAVRWLELIEPSQDDVARASEMAGIDAKLSHDALDLHERPRIELDDEVTLLVIRAPHLEDGNGHQPSQDSYSTVPLGVILTRTCIVTVCKLRDDSLVALLSASRGKPSGYRGKRCICNLSRSVALLFLHYRKGISATIREVERDISHSLDNEDLMLLLNLRKSVTYFHAALKTNDTLLDRVIRKGLTVGAHGRMNFTEEEDMLDDAQTGTRQGIYMSKIFTEVLGSITNVYSTIISNNAS